MNGTPRQFIRDQTKLSLSEQRSEKDEWREVSGHLLQLEEEGKEGVGLEGRNGWRYP